LKKQLLDYHLENSIRSFLWSGANSVYARDSAAKNLAKELSEDLKKPAAIPIIIAHSYAGNVALRALEHLRDPKYLRDPNLISRVRIVTLAAPFLKVFVRHSQISPLTWFFVALGCFSLIATLPTLIALLLVALAILASATFIHQKERVDNIKEAAHYRKIDAS